MKSSTRIRRHGYHLMSLASLGQVGCFALWIWQLFQLHLPDGRGVAGAFAETELALLVGVQTLSMLVQVWALARLRRIGKLLYSGTGIGHAMASAWNAFGRALLLAALMQLLPLHPTRGATGTIDVQMGLGTSGLYFFLVALLCVFSIARLLEDAALLKDDNEAIV